MIVLTFFGLLAGLVFLRKQDTRLAGAFLAFASGLELFGHYSHSQPMLIGLCTFLSWLGFSASIVWQVYGEKRRRSA